MTLNEECIERKFVPLMNESYFHITYQSNNGSGTILILAKVYDKNIRKVKKAFKDVSLIHLEEVRFTLEDLSEITLVLYG